MKFQMFGMSAYNSVVDDHKIETNPKSLIRLFTTSTSVPVNKPNTEKGTRNITPLSNP